MDKAGSMLALIGGLTAATAISGCFGTGHDSKQCVARLERKLARLREGNRGFSRRLTRLRRQAADSSAWQKHVHVALTRMHRRLGKLRRTVMGLWRIHRVRCLQAKADHQRVLRTFSDLGARVKALKEKIQKTRSGYQKRKLAKNLAPLEKRLSAAKEDLETRQAVARACKPFVPRGSPAARPAARPSDRSPPPAPPPPLPGVEPPARPRPARGRPRGRPSPTGA